MTQPKRGLVFAAILLWANAALAEPASALSEKDFLAEMPVVFSVSRLPQPLNETPGAVTVLDRDTLRRAGVRDLPDALRLVPGFLVSRWNGASPFVSYHNVLDQFGARLQVFVDGRSVYSTFYLGGTQRGLAGVVLEDVERIEVLRGSNSAAYGANAFLGVINIVTRHAADAAGTLVGVTGGGQGVRDNVLRHGWGAEDAHFRVTVARRSDEGMARLYDDSHLGQLNFRADWRPSPRDEVMFQAGGSDDSWGDGFANNAGNPQRVVRMRSAFAHGEWRRALAADEDVRVSFSHDDEFFHDQAPYATIPGVFLDFGGKARRTQAEFQHTLAPAANWRTVWGATWRDERVWSPALYFGQDWLSTRQWRLFGNVEWRPAPLWVVNAGALWENHSVIGDSLSPRLMLNYHLTPGHTLRWGVTHSGRAPTLFELRGDVRYYDPAKNLRGWTWAMRGRAEAEQLHVREVGYLGEFRPWNLTLDLRGYDEFMSDRIATDLYRIGSLTVKDKVNDPRPLRMRGIEYQLRWKPTPTTQIWFNQMATRNIGPNDYDAYTAPHRAHALAWFQSLPGDVDMTLTYMQNGAMTWQAIKDRLDAQHRVDLRVAKRLRFGATRAEAALTVQSADGGYREFLPAYTFARRTFASLKLEF